MSRISRKLGFPEKSNPQEWRETEQRSSRFAGLETWGTSEVLKALLGGQMQALNAVSAVLDDLEVAVEVAANAYKQARAGSSMWALEPPAD